MRRLLFVISLLLCLSVSAQQTPLTILVGEVYDARTGQPVEAVNVYLKNTPYGTTTTREGIFLLRVPLTKKTRLVVSAVGYHKEQFAVEPGISAGIDVSLREKTNVLEDVFVLPGSNPALELMERVRRQRTRNNLPVSWDEADKDLCVSVSDIRPHHLRRALWRNMREAMLTQADSTLLLPLYSRTTHSGSTKEQTAMMTSSDWKLLLDDFNQTVDFYHNTVPFLATSFLSPLASDGNAHYRYYLADSLTAGGRKEYEVHFRSRNPFFATFNGTMRIDSATAALTYMDAEVPQEAGVNYLRGLSVRQTFEADTTDGPATFRKSGEQVRMLLDFAVRQDTSRFFPSLLITASNRYPDALPAEEKAGDILPVVNPDLPLFRVATFAAEVIQTGYIPTGTAVDIGKVTEIIHANPQEMVRLGLPLRTNGRLSNTVCLEAYAACGLGDHAWKGAGMVHLNLPTQRRHILTFRYADEYVRADVTELTRMQRENSAWFSDMGITMHLMQMIRHWEALRNPAVRRREASIRTENDWTDNVETRLFFTVGREGYGMPTRNYDGQASFRYSAVGGTVRLGWQEKKVDLYFQRKHIYSRLPVVCLYGEAGSIRMEGEDNYHLYGRLGLMVRQQADLGIGGSLDWLVAGGIVLGNVPYTRLHLFEGNQSYAYDPYRFTLMDFNRYAADRYLLLHAEWNGRGCVFNHIPGLRWLRLRELLLLKIAYGGWNRNRTLCLPDNGDMDDLHIPYVEVGCGIGNILRIGDIYAVWRLTHRHGNSDPWWAIRFRLRLSS